MKLNFYNLNENDDDDQKYSKTKNNILIEQMGSSANKVAGNILKKAGTYDEFWAPFCSQNRNICANRNKNTISNAVELYSKAMFDVKNGRLFSFAPGSYRNKSEHGMNYGASSFKVSKDINLTVYSKENFTGDSWTIKGPAEYPIASYGMHVKYVPSPVLTWWADIACSSKGEHMYAVATTWWHKGNRGGVYHSTDNGENWTSVLSGRRCDSVAVSDTGQYVFVVDASVERPCRTCSVKRSNKISKDYGATFSETLTTPDNHGEMTFCAMSGNGKYIITGYTSIDTRYGRRGIWTNNNYGANNAWTHHYSGYLWKTRNAAVSKDGKYTIFFVTSGGANGDHQHFPSDAANKGLWLSSNYMQTFSRVKSINSNFYDAGCAMSSNGRYMTFASAEGVYVSNNFGVTFTLKLRMSSTELGAASQNNNRPTDISMSGDGRTIVLTAWGGYVYKSTNYGNNWSPFVKTLRRWRSVAMHSDASTIIICASPSGFSDYQGLLHKFSNDDDKTWNGTIKSFKVEAAKDEHGCVPYNNEVYCNTTKKCINKFGESCPVLKCRFKKHLWSNTTAIQSAKCPSKHTGYDLCKTGPPVDFRWTGAVSDGGNNSWYKNCYYNVPETDPIIPLPASDVLSFYVETNTYDSGAARERSLNWSGWYYQQFDPNGNAYLVNGKPLFKSEHGGRISYEIGTNFAVRHMTGGQDCWSFGKDGHHRNAVPYVGDESRPLVDSNWRYFRYKSHGNYFKVKAHSGVFFSCDPNTHRYCSVYDECLLKDETCPQKAERFINFLKLPSIYGSSLNIDAYNNFLEEILKVFIDIESAKNSLTSDSATKLYHNFEYKSKVLFKTRFSKSDKKLEIINPNDDPTNNSAKVIAIFKNDMNWSVNKYDWCLDGTADDLKTCCGKSCGQCGGVGCSKRPGGGNECCVIKIRDENKSVCSSVMDTVCNIPLHIVSYTPNLNETEVPLDAKIIIKVSDNCVRGSGKVTIKKFNGTIVEDNVENISIEDEGKKIIIAPKNELPRKTYVYLDIENEAFVSVQNGSSFELVSSNPDRYLMHKAIRFETELGDIVPPEITADPIDPIERGSQNINIDKGVSVYDEPLGVYLGYEASGNVDFYYIGDYERTYKAIDGAGNKSEKTRTIKVIDTKEPEIIAGDIDVQLGDTNANLNIGVSAYDQPGDILLDYTTEEDIPGTYTFRDEIEKPINLNEPGEYIRTYIATDAAKNTATKTRKINVKDDDFPIINVVPQLIKIERGDYEIDIDIDVSAYDKGQNQQIDVVASGNVNRDKPGTYTRTYTATDGSNNTSTRTRTVTVVDTTVPEINFNDLKIDLGSEEDIDENVKAFDQPGNIPVTFTATGDVNKNMAGVYIRNYKAIDDSGNIAIKARRIDVGDEYTSKSIVINEMDNSIIADHKELMVSKEFLDFFGKRNLLKDEITDYFKTEYPSRPIKVEVFFKTDTKIVVEIDTQVPLKEKDENGNMRDTSELEFIKEYRNEITRLVEEHNERELYNASKLPQEKPISLYQPEIEEEELLPPIPTIIKAIAASEIQQEETISQSKLEEKTESKLTQSINNIPSTKSNKKSTPKSTNKKLIKKKGGGINIYFIIFVITLVVIFYFFKK